MKPSLFPAIAVLFLIPSLGACGGDAGTTGASSDAAGDAGSADVGIEEQDAQHFLAVTVDGMRYEARGEPFGPSISFGTREVNVQVGGPLTSAEAAGKMVKFGDFDLRMNLLANAVEPGTYAMVGNRNKVTRTKEPTGFAEVFFPASVPIGKLRPISGSIELTAVEGRDVDGRYRLLKVEGTGEGQFFDAASVEHTVQIEFEYVR